jgi:TetR/AcrR family transcriptional regulator
MSRWANAIPDREEVLETKRRAIVREAAKVFNRRGSHGATLDDVADRLGVSKAALYRYVESKQDLLYACHQEAMEIARQSIDVGEAAGRNGLEKIQIGMSTYLREMIGAMGVPVLILEENVLSGKQAKEIFALRDAFEKRMRRLVEEGIADGSILPLNPKLAMFMLLGAVHWVTKWYSPDGPWTADDVAEALIEMATRGLAVQPSERLKARIHN